jgi:hypothetical protein
VLAAKDTRATGHQRADLTANNGVAGSVQVAATRFGEITEWATKVAAVAAAG